MALKDAVSGLNNGNSGDQVQSANGSWPEVRLQPPPLSRFYHHVPGGPMAFFPALWQPTPDRGGPGSVALEKSGSASPQGWPRSRESGECEEVKGAAAEKEDAENGDLADGVALQATSSSEKEDQDGQKMDQETGGEMGMTPGAALAGAWQALMTSPGVSGGAAQESLAGLVSSGSFCL